MWGIANSLSFSFLKETGSIKTYCYELTSLGNLCLMAAPLPTLESWVKNSLGRTREIYVYGWLGVYCSEK